ncbi:MAG: chemotaxis protein CheD [Desulfobacteraceae bacterium]|nr:chemotaxis protein CheD [Desulfobacteraceae bacterium]
MQDGILFNCKSPKIQKVISMPFVQVVKANIKFSQNKNDVLTATSLGCCIGVSLFDYQVSLGGLLISILPYSKKAQRVYVEENPFMFVDLAIPYFLKAAMEKGMQPESIKIVLAGAGRLGLRQSPFDVGTMNSQSALASLEQFGLKPVYQNIGGRLNRSMQLELKTGTTKVLAAGEEIGKI